MVKDTVVILDASSAAGQRIAREVRAHNVYCVYCQAAGAALPPGVAGSSVKGVLVNESDFSACEGFLRAQFPTAPVFTYVDGMADTAEGSARIKDFLYGKCGLKGEWTAQAFIDDQIRQIRAEVGQKRVLLALSGGVDSSVCAVLLQKAIGDQLKCIFVDHGMMRKNEAKQIESMFSEGFDISLKCIDAQDRFLGKLKGVTDPEQKRKIIGAEFIRVFEEEARQLGKVEFLAQGTIYPDIIESGIGADLVKSHHNVGGLPEDMGFDGLVEPLRELFKDEVRQVGEALGLPHTHVYRQPFPGPGLGVRCLGELTKGKLDLLRDADAIYREELENAGWGEKVWQYFAILTDCRSTGVKNAKRVYGHTIALRAVNTIDAMSASVARLPYELLETVAARITCELDGVNRVVLDITPKPPGTIEWE